MPEVGPVVTFLEELMGQLLIWVGLVVGPFGLSTGGVGEAYRSEVGWGEERSEELRLLKKVGVDGDWIQKEIAPWQQKEKGRREGLRIKRRKREEGFEGL
ncbi:hypothetical protein RJT34_30394 [Clitoria ternatea]|uniref:Uncharacterized protein n=1 Tax=Clitoria ternatea TaxID=43366 RepID=A0AAN9ET79_CLITE